jgi:hypothetical protein
MSKNEIEVWRRRGKVKGRKVGDENDVTLEENELGVSYNSINKYVNSG